MPVVLPAAVSTGDEALSNGQGSAASAAASTGDEDHFDGQGDAGGDSNFHVGQSGGLQTVKMDGSVNSGLDEGSGWSWS